MQFSLVPFHWKKEGEKNSRKYVSINLFNRLNLQSDSAQIQNGEDINAANKSGFTALFEAAQNGKLFSK